VRALFVVSGWTGHWAPLVPLGWGLGAAGHEVRVVCRPDQQEAVGRAGLVAAPLLRGLDMVLQTRLAYLWQARAGRRDCPWPLLHPVTGAELDSPDDFDEAAWMREERPRIARDVVDSHDRTVAFARTWRPDLVVSDPMGLEGLLAARVLGVPHAVHTWGPVGPAEDDVDLRLLPPDPARAFPRHGLGPLGPHLLDLVLDCAPRPAEGALAVRYVPWAGGRAPAGDLPAPGGLPRVCVVWGTSPTVMSGPRSFVLPDVLRALADLPVEVVLTASAADVERLGRLPRALRAAGSALHVVQDHPLGAALAGCDAVVHHGGAGCVMTSLVAGVPQLALTLAPEQAANGRRLAELGAGLQLPAHETAATVRAAVARLLDDPSFGAAARRLRAANAARPAPADVVRRLEQVVAARRGAGGPDARPDAGFDGGFEGGFEVGFEVGATCAAS
jgi:UDP:flavonoid glycosyltransferase YjiC (YdhE family)